MRSPGRVREVLGDLVEREGGGPPGWDGRLAGFLDLLEERNRRVNLVSRPTAPEALERHVLPSLAALLLVAPGTRARVLDVGSGGGFPGIPLVILRPEIRIDFVDSTRKKCEFLQECVDALAIANAQVHWCRIEAPSESLGNRAPFELMLARAVGAPEVLRQAAASLLSPGGRAWSFAAPGEGQVNWTDEGGRVVTTLLEVFPVATDRGHGGADPQSP